MILNLYKNRGETPLECIKRYRKTHPDLKEEKFTYLGRLDPMAEGVLLVGTGEDTSEIRRQEFMNLTKEYEFIAMFGFATDTYDALGKIMRVEKVESMAEYDLVKLEAAYIGKREQKYPIFSSKPISKKIDGKESKKPLHEWARRGEIEGGEIPTKEIEIFSMKFEDLQTLSPKELFGRLLMDISKVQGDFRQNEVLVQWKNILLGMKEAKIFLAKYTTKVSSGTYVRGLVDQMGNTLGCGALSLSITRTRVGEYNILDSLK